MFIKEEMAKDPYRRSAVELELVNAVASLAASYNALAMGINQVIPSVHAPPVDIQKILHHFERVQYSARSLLEGRGHNFTRMYNTSPTTDQRLALLNSLPDIGIYSADFNLTDALVRKHIIDSRGHCSEYTWANVAITNWVQQQWERFGPGGEEERSREDVLGPWAQDNHGGEIFEKRWSAYPVEIYYHDKRLCLLIDGVVEVSFATCNSRSEYDFIRVRTFFDLAFEETVVSLSGNCGPGRTEWIFAELVRILELGDIEIMPENVFKEKALAYVFPWNLLCNTLTDLLRTNECTGRVNLHLAVDGLLTADIEVGHSYRGNFAAELTITHEDVKLPRFRQTADKTYVDTLPGHQLVIHPYDARPALNILLHYWQATIRKVVFQNVSDELQVQVYELLRKQGHPQLDIQEEPAQ